MNLSTGESMTSFGGMNAIGSGGSAMNQQMNCNPQQQQQQQQQQLVGGAAGGRANNPPQLEAAWFGPNGAFANQLPLGLAAEDVAGSDDVESVEHLAAFGAHGAAGTGSAIHVKQEQLFGD